MENDVGETIMNRHSLCQFLKWVWENSVLLSFVVLTKGCTVCDLPETLLLTCSFTLDCPFSQVLLRSKGIQTAKKKHKCTVENISGKSINGHIVSLTSVTAQKTFIWARNTDKHCSIEFVCIMGMDGLESNTAEEDTGVLTHKAKHESAVSLSRDED